MSKSNSTLTAERLRERLRYDPETGVFTRKIKTNRNVRVGDVAGTTAHNGYRRIYLVDRDYSEHRLAWLYVYGFWPQNEIDHINGVRADNRIANLRDVPCSINRENQRRAMIRNYSSGLLGVSWHGACNKWRAVIQTAGKRTYLGVFDTKEKAYTAYLTAKRKLHAGCTL